MDNNKSAGHFLNNLMSSANNFIKLIETGEGLNLSEDQKALFKKQLAEQGGEQKIDELKNKLSELKEKIKRHANNQAHK